MTSANVQDKVFMVDLLGWSRGGNEEHLPDEIVREIKQLAFFDTRTEAYRKHQMMLRRRQNFLRTTLRPMISNIVSNNWANNWCENCGGIFCGGRLSPVAKCRCYDTLGSQRQIHVPSNMFKVDEHFELNVPSNVFSENGWDELAVVEPLDNDAQTYIEYGDDYNDFDELDDDYCDQVFGWDECDRSEYSEWR